MPPNDASLLLRLPSDMKAALQREAFVRQRTLTAEINIRLQRSLDAEAAPNPAQLPASYTAPNTPTAVSTKDNGPAGALEGTDRAMLELFRALPVEKQLALLSLLR